MKKLILTFALTIASLMVFAQDNTNSIMVTGSYQYTITPEYTAQMIVSMTNVYYDSQAITMSEVKSNYINKLEKAGIAGSRLVENDLYFALMGYEKEGTVIEFKTKSIEEMKKFLMVKSIGVTKSETNLKVTLTDTDMANYAKKAFENAKSKATAIAEKIGRKIGKATYIGDTNSNKISDSLYYSNSINTNKREYHISVSFELL